MLSLTQIKGRRRPLCPSSRPSRRWRARACSTRARTGWSGN